MRPKELRAAREAPNVSARRRLVPALRQAIDGQLITPSPMRDAKLRLTYSGLRASFSRTAGGDAAQKSSDRPPAAQSSVPVAVREFPPLTLAPRPLAVLDLPPPTLE